MFRTNSKDRHEVRLRVPQPRLGVFSKRLFVNQWGLRLPAPQRCVVDSIIRAKWITHSIKAAPLFSTNILRDHLESFTCSPFFFSPAEEKQQTVWAKFQLTEFTQKDNQPRTQSEWRWENVAYEHTRGGGIKAALVSSHYLLGFLWRGTPARRGDAWQRAEDEWDANLSWHVKLWLDQITRRSAVNGRAERLSSSHTGFSYRRQPVTLERLADRRVGRFQSSIGWEFAEETTQSHAPRAVVISHRGFGLYIDSWKQYHI